MQQRTGQTHKSLPLNADLTFPLLWPQENNPNDFIVGAVGPCKRWLACEEHYRKNWEVRGIVLRNIFLLYEVHELFFSLVSIIRFSSSVLCRNPSPVFLSIFQGISISHKMNLKQIHYQIHNTTRWIKNISIRRGYVLDEQRWSGSAEREPHVAYRHKVRLLRQFCPEVSRTASTKVSCEQKGIDLESTKWKLAARRFTGLIRFVRGKWRGERTSQ